MQRTVRIPPDSRKRGARYRRVFATSDLIPYLFIDALHNPWKSCVTNIERMRTTAFVDGLSKARARSRCQPSSPSHLAAQERSFSSDSATVKKSARSPLNWLLKEFIESIILEQFIHTVCPAEDGNSHFSNWTMKYMYLLFFVFFYTHRFLFSLITYFDLNRQIKFPYNKWPQSRCQRCLYLKNSDGLSNLAKL